MLKKIMKAIRVNTLVGLILATPVVATILIFNFLFGLATGWMVDFGVFRRWQETLGVIPLKILVLLAILAVFYVVGFLARNVLGRRLRASGRMHLKGLGVHSQARLTYLLNEPFDRFEAALALDDATQGGGSVRCHVLVDGRRQFSSEPVRGGRPPVPVRVDLAGAKRLELVVDFGERADVLDYADWLDARLVRGEKE